MFHLQMLCHSDTQYDGHTVAALDYLEFLISSYNNNVLILFAWQIVALYSEQKPPRLNFFMLMEC